MSQCPCGSQKTFQNCCELFLESKNKPETPEQLMRSRYTAYNLARIDYIKNTMKGKASLTFNEADARSWAQSVTWISLKIIQSSLETCEKGHVEFIATFLENNQIKVIHELSEFNRENNIWFYTDGIDKQITGKNKQQKVARNTPCPCRSGKKFKNCHGK